MLLLPKKYIMKENDNQPLIKFIKITSTKHIRGALEKRDLTIY